MTLASQFAEPHDHDTDMSEATSWTFDVPCRREAIPPTQESLRQVLRARGVSARRIRYTLIVTEELLDNIIAHAERAASPACIQLHLAFEKDEIVLAFLDDGPPFDPLELPELELKAGMGERQAAGLGVHLVRQLAKACHYVHAERTNVLVIGLSLETHAQPT